MRAYELVLAEVERDLAAGRLRLGGRLPGERALSQRLGVSRSSVREALQVLEAMGVVRRAVGSGPDAGAVVVAEPSTAITSALRLHLATSHLPVSDILQTRVLLESWALSGAAARVIEADLGAAERLLDAMDDPTLTPEEFHRMDAEYHIALTAMAGNVLIAATMAALRDAIHGYVIAAVPNLPNWRAMADRLRAEHRAVLAAVRDGDGERAAALVTAHIENFYRDARVDRA